MNHISTLLYQVICFLKQHFPASSADVHRELQAMNERLVSLSSEHACLWTEARIMEQNIQELCSMLQRTDRRIDAISEENQAIKVRLENMDKAAQEAYRETQTYYGDLSAEISGAWAAVSQTAQEVSSEISRINADLSEIMHGDIFRRIEFLQAKMVFMEGMVQRHLLPQSDQREGALYCFIMRMRGLFPLMSVCEGSGFVRIGRKNDGGYVMFDDFEGRKYAYSIGLADDVSWDRDIASRGLDVYMYDHTIQGLPEKNDRFHFFQIGVRGSTEEGHPDLQTLEDMMEANGHAEEYGMILKVDVEGAEWSVLNDVEENTIKRFSQIVFEFHGLTQLENREKITTAMKKLNRTHQLVHLHANNYGSYLLIGGKILPELIEGTYLLRDEYAFSPAQGAAATALDEANCPYLPDIFLGNWGD